MDPQIAPADDALQHGHAPRPLPLFLELVRDAARDDPAMARRALDGLTRYAREQRGPAPVVRPTVVCAGGARLRDHGGTGSPVVLVPSLINPPHVLDLPGQSLAVALAARHRVLLVDWGPAAERLDLDLGGHIEALLVPLLRGIGAPTALVGYCLGGTMAMAAAGLIAVTRLATLAAPWHFSAYPAASRDALKQLWDGAEPTARALGVLPTELLQAAFWSLDPRGVVTKYARLAEEPEASADAGRFVTLEDWANDGQSLPLPAARELIEVLFRDDAPGKGEWRVGKAPVLADLAVPTLHFTARNDRIVPAASAPPGPSREVAAGHVGMVVGSRAPQQLYAPLLAFL